MHFTTQTYHRFKVVGGVRKNLCSEDNLMLYGLQFLISLLYKVIDYTKNRLFSTLFLKTKIKKGQKKIGSIDKFKQEL